MLPSYIAYLIVAPLLSFTGTVLNLCTMYIFGVKIPLDAFSRIFIVNICVCDILSCIFSNSIYIVNTVVGDYSWNLGAFTCKMLRFFTMYNCVAQVWSLVAINIYRQRRIIDSNMPKTSRGRSALTLFAILFLACFLTVPRIFQFGEKYTYKNSSTEVFNVMCKPVEFRKEYYIFMTSVLFVFGFVIPLLLIVYITCRVHLFLFLRKKVIHPHLLAKFNFIKKKITVALNFTGIIFLLIWSPFFILSILDLQYNLANNYSLINMNITLRCTLLLLGSLKPIIYVVTIERFKEILIDMVFALKVKTGNQPQITDVLAYSTGECSQKTVFTACYNKSERNLTSYCK